MLGADAQWFLNSGLRLVAIDQALAAEAELLPGG
jgi:hypothetical protein